MWVVSQRTSPMTMRGKRGLLVVLLAAALAACATPYGKGERSNVVLDGTPAPDPAQVALLEARIEKWTRTSAAGSSCGRQLAHALNERACAEIRKGEFERAMTDLDQAIAAAPDFADAYNNRGAIWTYRGQEMRAIEEYNLAIKVDPAHAKALSNRSLSFLHEKQLDRAFDDINRAIAFDPHNPIPYVNRANIWLAMDQPDRAMQDFDAAIAASPNDPYGYFARGIEWLHRNEPDKFAADFERAKELQARQRDPGSPAFDGPAMSVPPPI